MSPRHPLADPWLAALVAQRAAETPTLRLRRHNRAARRGPTMIFVPPTHAPLDLPAGPSTPAHRLPVRLIIALWAQGHGADVTHAIAARTGCVIPRTAITRLFTRARGPWPGAEPVEARRLAAELDARLPDLPRPADLDPWLAALLAHEATESLTARLRRQNRAGRRAGATLHLPPVGAPEAPVDGYIDRYGRTSKRGRPRALLPMRPTLTLWALGFGADAVVELAARADHPAPRTTITRLFMQARRPFRGAEPVTARTLADALAERMPGAARTAGSLAARMHAWRALNGITKIRAARLAGIRPALWIRLERGHTARFTRTTEAIERLIDPSRRTTP